MKHLALKNLVRIGLVPTTTAMAFVACQTPSAVDEIAGSTSSALMIKGGGVDPSGGVVSTGGSGQGGSGGASTGGRLTGVLTNVGTVLAPTTTSCAPEFDSINVAGATCFDVAKNTPDGLLTVSSVFPAADAAVRDHACLAVFLPAAPACKPFDPAMLTLPANVTVMAIPRPDCAGNPSACQGASNAVTPSLPAQIPPQAHVIPHGTVGGCDVCGITVNDVLYFTNPGPIDPLTAGYIAVPKADGTTSYFALATTNAGSSAYQAPLTGGPFVNGQAYAWWPSVGGTPPPGFPGGGL